MKLRNKIIGSIFCFMMLSVPNMSMTNPNNNDPTNDANAVPNDANAVPNVAHIAAQLHAIDNAVIQSQKRWFMIPYFAIIMFIMLDIFNATVLQKKYYDVAAAYNQIIPCVLAGGSNAWNMLHQLSPIGKNIVADRFMAFTNKVLPLFVLLYILSVILAPVQSQLMLPLLGIKCVFSLLLHFFYHL